VDKKPPPLLGFNNNVRHHGRIFHIQTEDSGIKHARIVTHLFADGGRIVNSTRTDYAEHLGQPDMHEVLRRIMREQHKAMFIRLRAGELDSLIESACGPPPTPGDGAKQPELGPSAAVPVAPPPLPAPVAASPEPPVPPGAAPRPAAEPPPAPPPPPKRRRLSNPNLQPAPPSMAPPAGEIDLDEAMLSGSERRPASRRSRPASAPTPEPPAAASTPEPPAAAPAAEPEPPSKPAEEEARYAPPRPPNIFEAPLTEHSIFGERLIREKSLDEVILSYLAEDLDGGTNE
jgi:hypothetical protein